MASKLGLVVALIFVTVTAATEVKPEPFSILNVWRSSIVPDPRTRGGPQPIEVRPDWILKVQSYHDDLGKGLNTFPKDRPQLRDAVRTPFQTLLAKVVTLSNSKSKVLSSGANGILDALSLVKVDDQSAQGILDEFYRAFRLVMIEYREVTNNLTEVVGADLVNAVNNAITNTENECYRFVDEFNAVDANGLHNDVDLTPVKRRVEKLVDTVKLRGDVTLGVRQLANPSIQEALVILSLMADHIVTCSHGLSSCTQSILLKERCSGSQSG